MRKLFVIPFVVLAWIALAFTKTNGDNWPVGKEYKGFRVTKSIQLAEVQSELVELVHQESGAEVLYIRNDDPENFFSIAFRTPPKSSNGVAHVLEHTVFQGSQKYPSRGIFHQLKQRTMPTYINAGTGPDFTSFHAASLVEEDFYNLFEVYFDAVFHPLLRLNSFAQEGHRIEFAEIGDPNSPLEYKGVVFNEMKGVMASPRAQLMKAVSREIFPDTHYSFNAGGDPQEIPKLTHQALLEFHREHYHLGNALFFFHGNLPLEKHLDFLSEKGLENQPKKPKIPPFKMQPRFTKPVHVELAYPTARASDQSLIAISFLACTTDDTEEVMALKVLDTCLMGTDAGLLKSELLKSNLCKQAKSSLDTVRHELSYTLCLEGVKAEDIEQLKQLAMQRLEAIASQGIPQDLIESAINKHELERSEIGGRPDAFEQSCFIKCALLKLYGGKAENGLKIKSLFDRCHDLKFLQAVLKKHFLDNKHVVFITLNPSLNLGEEQMQKERETLEAIKATLNDNEIVKISNLAKELRTPYSEEPNLPKTRLSSIQTKPTTYPLSKESVGALDIYHHDVFTNHITYVDLVFPIPEIEEDDIWLLPLFTNLLTQVGHAGRSALDSIKHIESLTGGMHASVILYQNAQNANSARPKLTISASALDSKANALCKLLYEIVTAANFDDKTRLKEHISKECHEIETAIQQNPLHFCTRASLASFGETNALVNRWMGLDYYHKLKGLNDNFDEQAGNLIQRLEMLQSKIFASKMPHLVLTCAKESLENCQTNNFGNLTTLLIKEQPEFKMPSVKRETSSFAYLISSPVSFTAQSMQSLPYSHPKSAALLLATYLFDNKVLRQRVREERGAYGVGALYNPTTSNLCFYSYRDPNIASTLAAFREALEEIALGNFTEQDLEMAKLEAFQALNLPQAPGRRARYAYDRLQEGKDDGVLFDFRARLLSARCLDVQEAVKIHIEPSFNDSAVVTFTGQALLEKENSKLRVPLKTFNK